VAEGARLLRDLLIKYDGDWARMLSEEVKVYRLTATGKKQLLSERSRWEQRVAAIGGILNHVQSW